MSLINDLEKLTKGKHILNALLGNQCAHTNKLVLGFYRYGKYKKCETLFVKAVSLNYKHFTCFYYNYKGHIAKFCAYKRGIFNKKLIWLSKKSNLICKANKIRPKLI